MAQIAQTTKSSRTGTILQRRSVQITLGVWIVALALAYLLGQDGLPFDQPLTEDFSFGTRVGFLLFSSLALPFIYMGVTYFITRNRAIPEIASRAPDRAVALREVVYLIAYGVSVFALGQVIGQLVFGEGFGFHLHGAIYGATHDVGIAEVLGWATYNFVGYAAIPYLVFRRRGYSDEALSLKSSNRKNDVLVILAVLGIGAAIDLTASDIFSLSGTQILVGLPLTLVIHLLGTGLPVMVFIYAILLPRYLKLSGSVTTTVILGGLTYAALHVLEPWTLYNGLTNSVLSVIFVFMQFFGPGMIKSYLTLRTGNAWVHVWAYHSFSPHLTFDTSNIVRFFGIR